MATFVALVWFCGASCCELYVGEWSQVFISDFPSVLTVGITLLLACVRAIWNDHQYNALLPFNVHFSLRLDQCIYIVFDQVDQRYSGLWVRVQDEWVKRQYPSDMLYLPCVCHASPSGSSPSTQYHAVSSSCTWEHEARGLSYNFMRFFTVSKSCHYSIVCPHGFVHIRISLEPYRRLWQMQRQ